VVQPLAHVRSNCFATQTGNKEAKNLGSSKLETAQSLDSSGKMLLSLLKMVAGMSSGKEGEQRFLAKMSINGFGLI